MRLVCVGLTSESQLAMLSSQLFKIGVSPRAKFSLETFSFSTRAKVLCIPFLGNGHTFDPQLHCQMPDPQLLGSGETCPHINSRQWILLLPDDYYPRSSLV